MKNRFPFPYRAAAAAALCILLAPGARAETAAPRPLRVFTYHGYWYEHLAVERAFARMGGAIETHSWLGPGLLPPRPESPPAIAAYDMIIAGGYDVSAWTGTTGRVFVDFVRDGGAIVFFGGYKVIETGFQGTPLEEICPVISKPGSELVHEPSGIPLAPGPQAVAWSLPASPWMDQPRTCWMHDMTPKPGADVLMTAGPRPFLVVGKYGRGSVAVCAGTVMGDVPPGQVPFWNWSAWPTVLARILERMAPRDKTGAGLPEKISAETMVYPPVCHDTETARRLLAAAVGLKDDLSPASATAIFLAVRQHADAAFAGFAEELVATSQTNRVALGLWLLGRMRGSGVLERLLRIACSGEASPGIRRPRTGNDDLEAILSAPAVGENPLGDIEPAPTAVARRDVFRNRLAAIEGLGNSGDPAAVPLLRQLLKELAPLRTPVVLPLPVARRPEDDLLDEAVLGAVLCGDAEPAAALVGLLVTNRYTAVAMYMASQQERDPRARDALKAAGDELALRTWRDCARLDAAPPAVLPALAEAVADCREEWVAPFAFRLFGRAFTHRRAVPAAVSQILKRSPVPAVAELAIGQGEP